MVDITLVLLSESWTNMNFLKRIVRRYSEEDMQFYYDLKKTLKFKPLQLEYYKRAFTHRSLKLTNNKGEAINYERLEFLGDAVIGSVIASYLYETSPNGNEGYLTKMRSKLVSRKNLNDLGRKLNLIRFVKSNTHHETGINIHGNIFEALVGAIYLDRGYNYCHKFINDQIISNINLERLETKITSYKSLIIEWCQKTKREYHFESYEDTGNQPQKHFSVKITINGKLVAKGRGTSKKKAEELASKRVYFTFQNEF